MAIPFVSYAPARGRITIDTTTGPSVNQSIEMLKVLLSSLGWSNQGIRATSGVYLLICPTLSEQPLPRFPYFDNVLFLEGCTYAFYDPRIDSVPSALGDIPIKKQSTAEASLIKLVEAITTCSSYVASLVDSQHLRLVAKMPGTSANDLPCAGNGVLSVASPAKGGGYRFASQPANGITSISVDLVEGQFGNLVIVTRLADHEETYPLGKIPYDALANPYQLAIYPPNDQADYPAYNDIYQHNTGVFVCAPWVPSDHRLDYCGFALFGTASMHKTTSTISSVVIAVNDFYHSGIWPFGDSGYALDMLRVPNDPLLDPRGRSILQEALISLSPQAAGLGDAGSTVVVGRVWHAVAESRWNARGAETFLDGRRWALLMSDQGTTGSGGDVGGRTPSSLWLVCE